MDPLDQDELSEQFHAISMYMELGNTHEDACQLAQAPTQAPTQAPAQSPTPVPIDSAPKRPPPASPVHVFLDLPTGGRFCTTYLPDRRSSSSGVSGVAPASSCRSPTQSEISGSTVTPSIGGHSGKSQFTQSKDGDGDTNTTPSVHELPPPGGLGELPEKRGWAKGAVLKARDADDAANRGIPRRETAPSSSNSHCCLKCLPSKDSTAKAGLAYNAHTLSPPQSDAGASATAGSGASRVEVAPPSALASTKPTWPRQDAVASVSARPTVTTVELAAAAKIYLETHFNSLLCGPPSRTRRANHLERALFGAKDLTLAEKQSHRQAFYETESANLRETRVLKAKCAKALFYGDDGSRASLSGAMCISDFEVLKILGKGSFGTVRLVREKPGPLDEPHVAREKRKQVYAIKVIRKSEMLRSGQEGHLRAERDFLVSADGSNWVVPLVASFQDVSNLYLVMEFMPGGDFLGLLIREHILDEAVTKFYVAEMILCVEEAHALQYIHRDIKPDNFLVSASGHLKISDFGLAFDGHWSHDSRYYSSTRYSLLETLGIYVAGDKQDQKKDQCLATPGAMACSNNMMAGLERHQRPPQAGHEEPILQWRNRCGNHAAATSVVGTSQYMAPEVVKGDSYDGRCDWWSIGIILFECLYGFTPFLSEEGRQQTKKNIMNHQSTFCLPSWPPVSKRCQQLMTSLITEKHQRLCSKRYQLRDSAIADQTRKAGGGISPLAAAAGSHRDVATHAAGRSIAHQYVFPYDAEDIKAHKFFKGVPWEHLHMMPPPFVPNLRTEDDTRYFDEDGGISDT